MKKAATTRKRQDMVIYLRMDKITLEAIDKVADLQKRSRSAQIAYILQNYISERQAQVSK